MGEIEKENLPETVSSEKKSGLWIKKWVWPLIAVFSVFLLAEFLVLYALGEEAGRGITLLFAAIDSIIAVLSTGASLYSIILAVESGQETKKSMDRLENIQKSLVVISDKLDRLSSKEPVTESKEDIPGFTTIDKNKHETEAEALRSGTENGGKS
mgnify:CR=1 FL=1